MSDADAHAPAWEYETVRPPRDETGKEAEDPKPLLNELGADGWELVETVAYEGGGTKYFVFKRRRSPGDECERDDG